MAKFGLQRTRGRRRRRNPGTVATFVHEHPYLTFFIVGNILTTIVLVARGNKTA